MRQQILENQVKDLRQLLDEAIDEVDTMAGFLDPDDKRLLDVEATIKRLRERADEVVAR